MGGVLSVNKGFYMKACQVTQLTQNASQKGQVVFLSLLSSGTSSSLGKESTLSPSLISLDSQEPAPLRPASLLGLPTATSSDSGGAS